jgi:hypothetical protein
VQGKKKKYVAERGFFGIGIRNCLERLPFVRMTFLRFWSSDVVHAVELEGYRAIVRRKME